jgi:hypothetical protein
VRKTIEVIAIACVAFIAGSLFGVGVFSYYVRKRMSNAANVMQDLIKNIKIEMLQQEQKEEE